MRVNIQLIRSTAAHGLEAIAAVGLVLAFFSVFLGLLDAFFPSGASLRDLTERRGFFGSAGLAEQSVRDFLSSGQQNGELTAPQALAATLTGVRNSVKSKPADTIAWTAAQAGMPLHDRDAVQTFSESSAAIAFDPENYLDLGENSLMIVRRIEQDPLQHEKRSFLVMMDGELRGRIGGPGHPLQVEVTTPGAVASIRSARAEGGPGEFKITVHPDQSSTIAIYQGVADVAAEGRVVRVEANRATTVERGQPPGPPRLLPDPPLPTSPEDAAVFYYRDLPPRIRFTWGGAAGAQAYHFILARDPALRDPVEEERVSEPGFTHGNLKPGDYYWRVSGILGDREGSFSAPRRIRVGQDREPPALRVEFPPQTVNRNHYLLRGSTEPGARVFVGGQRVAIRGTGEFEHDLQLQHGINLIVVEAVDRAGNVTYRSRMVHGKF